MRQVLTIFLIFEMIFLNPAFAQREQDIFEEGYGWELFMGAFPYLEMGINIKNTPMIVRGKISYVIAGIYFSTEISYKNTFHDKNDLFLALSAYGTLAGRGTAVQAGIDIPREKKGRFWRVALAYNRLSWSHGTHEYFIMPVVGLGYRF